MVNAPPNPFLRFVRRVSGGLEGPDRLLLARFTEHRDEAAFAAIVQRHGPLVWSVCRRVLGVGPDAEDCFQATFFVLARKARYLKRPDLLSNWLYAVAYRTALRARSLAARRPGQDVPEQTAPENDPADQAGRNEIRRILDAELSRLPERYRMPLVLCYLEGQSHQEAARRLGCPRKTITTRLARACEQLRGRLASRGLALSLSAVVAALMKESAAKPVAVAVAKATAGVAAAVSAGVAANRAAVGASPRPPAARPARALRGISTANKVRVAAVCLLALLGTTATVNGPEVYQELVARSKAAATTSAKVESEATRQETPAKRERSDVTTDLSRVAKKRGVVLPGSDAEEQAVTGERPNAPKQLRPARPAPGGRDGGQPNTTGHSSNDGPDSSD